MAASACERRTGCGGGQVCVPRAGRAQVGASFILGGLIPTIAVILGLPQPWMQFTAYGLTALTALLLGVLKTRYSVKGAVRNGVEFLAVVTAGTAAGGRSARCCMPPDTPAGPARQHDGFRWMVP